MAKLYKTENPRETMCKDLHVKMNNQVGPTKLVPLNMYLLVDTDELQKQVNRLENRVIRNNRVYSRLLWTGSRRRKTWR